MSYLLAWLIISGVCLISEIFTAGFLLFFPGIAAFITAITAWLGFSFTLQCIIFVIMTILMILFIRPIVTKLFKVESIKTNTNAIIGKTGIVIKELSKDKKGQIKVDSEIWTAISTSSDIIAKDSLVTVNKIDGVKLIVEKI